MKNRKIEIDELRKYLPHRYPFMLVDRITEVQEDAITGIKNVTINEPFFQGHFPEFPVMPGVLIVEAMAQTAGVYAKLKTEENGDTSGEGKQPFFVSIDGVKFKRPIRPGDQLVITAKFIKVKMGIWWFDCTATVDGETACIGTISAMFK